MVEMVVGGLLGLLWLFVVVLAIIRVANSTASGLTKLLWILVLIFFPFVGVIVWLLIGPGTFRHSNSGH
jgi:hypothetical protein